MFSKKTSGRFQKQIQTGEPGWWTLRVIIGGTPGDLSTYDQQIMFSVLLNSEPNQSTFFDNNTLVEEVKWQTKLSGNITVGTGDFRLYAAQRTPGCGPMHLHNECTITWYRDSNYLPNDTAWVVFDTDNSITRGGSSSSGGDYGGSSSSAGPQIPGCFPNCFGFA